MVLNPSKLEVHFNIILQKDQRLVSDWIQTGLILDLDSSRVRAKINLIFVGCLSFFIKKNELSEVFQTFAIKYIRRSFTGFPT